MSAAAAVADAMAAMGPEMRSKFDRYASPGGDPKQMTLAGFKYLIKSSVGIDLGDDALAAAFRTAADAAAKVRAGDQAVAVRRAALLT